MPGIAFGPRTGGGKLPFLEVEISSAPIADDPMDVTTGIFIAAGAQTIHGNYSTPALPASGALFVEDSRVRILLNGREIMKGADVDDNLDCYWVSATQIAFEGALQIGDIIKIYTPVY